MTPHAGVGDTPGGLLGHVVADTRPPLDGPAAVSTTMRFREAAPSLLALPWGLPLEAWPDHAVRFVELPVGESRHLVRFVEVDGKLIACKELPIWPARREYEVMRALETKAAPAVRVIGLVERAADDAAILVTRYLARSLQLRRLFRRMSEGARRHRERLLDAMTMLLVELHRNGVFWGDASLANTLLLRDGQALQAHLVDAETSEVYAALSDGQRALDVSLAVENVAGELADIAASLGRSLDEADDEMAAALSLRERYARLWDEIHREEPLLPDERFRIEARLRRLNAMGFVVDEVVVEPIDDDVSRARLRVGVGSRRFHARRLRQLTGLDVGEGQATVLLNDIAAWAGLAAPGGPGIRERDLAGETPLQRAARRWLVEVFEPEVEKLRASLGRDIDPVQSYCDLLEVRWLLSEEAGLDVGDPIALEHLAARQLPVGSAAGMVVAEQAPMEPREAPDATRIS